MKRDRSEHLVCFRCRRMMRRPYVLTDGQQVPTESIDRPCPECGVVMTDMGSYFRPPQKRNRVAWENMRVLAAHGVRFTNDDAAWWYYNHLGIHRLGTARAIDLIEQCNCHFSTSGQRLARQFKRA